MVKTLDQQGDYLFTLHLLPGNLHIKFINISMHEQMKNQYISDKKQSDEYIGRNNNAYEKN